MPDAFWFVSSVAVALVVASEWARRRTIRGMRSPPPVAMRDELAERRQRSRARPGKARRAGRAAHVARRGRESIAIPQWQRDPPDRA